MMFGVAMKGLTAMLRTTGDRPRTLAADLLGQLLVGAAGVDAERLGAVIFQQLSVTHSPS